MLYFLLQIIDGVRDEMIHLHTKFCSRNPSFLEQNGKVSIVAHSLGSVIAYDILTLWDIELRHLSQDATESTGFLTESFQYLRSVSGRAGHEQTEAGSESNLKKNVRVQLAKARSEVMRLEARVVSEVEHGKHGADKTSKDCPFALPFKVRDSFTVLQIYTRDLKQRRRRRQGRRLEKNQFTFYRRISHMPRSVQYVYRSQNLLTLNMQCQRTIPKENTKNKPPSFHGVVLQRTAKKMYQEF